MWGLLSLFFFFQAEDGIRGGHVTGVQTCALPISVLALSTKLATRPCFTARCPRESGSIPSTTPLTPRSEERRVGKECRSGCSPDHCKQGVASWQADRPSAARPDRERTRAR